MATFAKELKGDRKLDSLLRQRGQNSVSRRVAARPGGAQRDLDAGAGPQAGAWPPARRPEPQDEAVAP